MAVVYKLHIDGLVQGRHNSSALAVELRLSCINLSICFKNWWKIQMKIKQSYGYIHKAIFLQPIYVTRFFILVL